MNTGLPWARWGRGKPLDRMRERDDGCGMWCMADRDSYQSLNTTAEKKTKQRITIIIAITFCSIGKLLQVVAPVLLNKQIIIITIIIVIVIIRIWAG